MFQSNSILKKFRFRKFQIFISGSKLGRGVVKRINIQKFSFVHTQFNTGGASPWAP
jgi:hypothetical protein